MLVVRNGIDQLAQLEGIPNRVIKYVLDNIQFDIQTLKKAEMKQKEPGVPECFRRLEDILFSLGNTTPLILVYNCERHPLISALLKSRLAKEVDYNIDYDYEQYIYLKLQVMKLIYYTAIQYVIRY